MTLVIPTTDTASVKLPPEWEMRTDLDGRVYFANHVLKTTQWQHPITGKQLIAKTKEEEEDDGKFHSKNLQKKLLNLFPASFTAMEVLEGQNLSGNVFVITGGNSGIGYRAAEALAFYGGHVIIACRNMEKAMKAVMTIKAACSKRDICANIEAMLLDLASFKSIRCFAQNLKNKNIPLHVLICNAAVLGYPWQTTEDNIEYTFAVNYLGHFLLIDELKALLISSSPSRIIMVSSESHRFIDLDYSSKLDLSLVPLPKGKYWSILAYNQSKLCCIMLSMELNCHLQSHGVTSYAVNPGNLIYTSLCESTRLYWLLFFLAKPFTKTPSQAAATLVCCATALELQGVGGLYLNGFSQCDPSPDAVDKAKTKGLWKKSMDMIHGNVENINALDDILHV